MPQAQKLPQERLLGLAEQGHVRAILAAAEHCAERDDQNLVQIVPDVLLPGVGDLRKARNKLLHETPPKLNPMVRIQQPAVPQA
jgi:hypothetical protein